MERIYHVHWSELNELGRKNVLWTLAQEFVKNQHVIPVDEWPGLFTVCMRLPVEWHKHVNPHGLKLTKRVNTADAEVDAEEAFDLLRSYYEDGYVSKYDKEP